MSALEGFEDGKRSEHVEYGERLLRDSPGGKKGHVEQRFNDYDPYGGAYYVGGPKWFERVQRTIVTYEGPWVHQNGSQS